MLLNTCGDGGHLSNSHGGVGGGRGAEHASRATSKSTVQYQLQSFSNSSTMMDNNVVVGANSHNKIHFGNTTTSVATGDRERYHHNGNGDIFYQHRGGLDMDPASDLTDELLPEDIPGLPRHRPGEMSPR